METVELPPMTDLAQFHCLRLMGCKRCQHRREAAMVRVGSSSPRAALDVNRSSTSTPPRASQVPRLPAPPSPAPTVATPRVPRLKEEPATSAEVQPCQQIANLLATFTKRIQSFFLTLMGFNHPHMQRLQIALQQQVQALAAGLTDLMTKQSAFLSLRSAMREGKLWERLRQRHQALFERGQELKECASLMCKEKVEKEAALSSTILAQRQLDHCYTFAAKLRRNAKAQADLLASFHNWRCFTSNRLSCRKTACQAYKVHHASSQAFQLQGAFFQWQRARSSIDRVALQEMKIKMAKFSAASTLGMVEVTKVKAFLHSAEERSKDVMMTSCLLAWRFFLARSRIRNSQERAEDLCQSMRSTVRQKNLKLWTRLGDPRRLTLKVAYTRWIAGMAFSSAGRWSREASAKVAAYSGKILERRQEVARARLCLAYWNRWIALSIHRKQLPEGHCSVCIDPVCRDTCSSPTTDLYFRPTAPRHSGEDSRSRLKSCTTSARTPVRTSWRPSSAPDAGANQAYLEAPLPSTDMLNAQLASHFNATFHQDTVMRHWSLASQASMSEEGYLKLLEFHREQARIQRRERRA